MSGQCHEESRRQLCGNCTSCCANGGDCLSSLKLSEGMDGHTYMKHELHEIGMTRVGIGMNRVGIGMTRVDSHSRVMQSSCS
jgi:hypothetical protein